MPELKAGDAVLYVPHTCHALEKDADGDHPWEIGWRENAGHPNPEMAAKVTVLSAESLHHRLEYIKRLPVDQAPLEKAKLVYTRPVKPWPATVTAVNPAEGTVSLDIKTAQGFTLHYTVPVDQVGKAPHTCHVKENANA